METKSESEIVARERLPGDAEHEPSIEPENELVGTRLILIHAGTTLATFLCGLDSNLIATSIPVITSDFNSITDVGWYGAAFYIAMCTSQPLSGTIYTIFPKKPALLCYLLIFAIGNLVCALAPSSTALIVGRAVTGLGASGVFVGGIVVLATIIPLHKRAIWQGTQVMVFSIASIVGPVIGGALTQSVSWRWCFWITLPCDLVAAILILALQIRKADPATNWSIRRKLQAIDFVGFMLVAGMTSMLLLALQYGGVEYPWNSSVVIGLFVGAAVTAATFVCWSIYRGDGALVPTKLFGHRNAVVLLVSGLFAAGPFQVIIYWLPIWFQAIFHLSPLQSGVRYLPIVIADTLTCIIGSGMIMKLGIWNPFLLLSNALISIAGGLLTTISPMISEGHLIGYQILAGVGFGLLNNVAHIGMQASIPKELVPVGTSSLMATMAATCAIYLAVGQTIFQDRLAVNLASVPSGLVQQLLAAGATDIREIVSPSDLPVVIDGYSKSITQVFYLPAAAAVVGFSIALGLKWTSLKRNETNETTRQSHDTESDLSSTHTSKE